MISAYNLSKSYNGKTVVSDLSFQISPGQIYGFLGQNGAGKSTTLRMLLSLVKPDAGSITIKNQKITTNNKLALKHVGAIIERPDLYGYLSAFDNLRLFVKLTGIKIYTDRLYNLIEFVGLKGRENDKVSSYSLGMKQRLAIAISLAHDPEILILDEPTNGLDPMGIVDMRKLLTTLSREQGKTILISSHLLSEIEQIATNVLVIHKGKKVVEGPMSSIINPDDAIVDIVIKGEPNVENIKRSDWVHYLQKCDGNKIHFKMNTNNIPQLNKWLVEHDYQVLNINSNRSLENYFLSSTND